MKHTGIHRMGERWGRYQPSKAQALWFAAGCVALTLIAGFGFGGWVTGATAQEQLMHASASARRQLATTLCVESFMQAQDAGERLQRVKDAAWYDREELVAKGGWATLPGETTPNYRVAEMCAAKLAQVKTGEIATAQTK